MSSRKFNVTEQSEAVANLKALLKPGSQVQVIQRHVSASGMQRRLSLLFVNSKGVIRDITRDAAAAMGDRLQDDYTIKVDGCGMNMHFATVYNLASVLYRDGHRCTGKRGCPSNDHSNDYGTAGRAFDDQMQTEGREWPARDEEEAYAAMYAERRAYIEQRLASDLGYRKGRQHSDGGYALTHRTL